MSQKLEANALKIVANNQGYQVKGDVKINGQAASLDYRKPAEGDADVRLAATLDDAGRARLGLDLGPAVSGSIPIKLVGKVSSDHDSKMGIEADLTQLRLDNILPGWSKLPGKSGKATFNVVPKAQSTRFEDIVIEGGPGVSIKGSLEVDQNGDLLNANFPTYSPSEGDKTSLKADRGADGVVKVTMRGDVFDGRSFLKSAMSGSEGRQQEQDQKHRFRCGSQARRGGRRERRGLARRRPENVPARRHHQGLQPQRQGRARHAGDGGNAGPLAGPGPRCRHPANQRRRCIPALHRYLLQGDGRPTHAGDGAADAGRQRQGRPPQHPRFHGAGRGALDRAAAGGPPGTQSGIAFSALRAEFTRQSGLLTVREGVVKGPSIGLTIEGNIDFNTNQVRMSGTIIPMYGLNNMFGQVPLLGLFIGGGSNEGLIGVTYEVVGSPGSPVLRVNPISALLPGVTRKIMEFNTGKPNNQIELPPNN